MGDGAGADAEALEGVAAGVVPAAVWLLACFVNARQDAAEVQRRQGFPSLSRITPLGSLVMPAGTSSSLEAVEELAAAGVWWGKSDLGSFGCVSDSCGRGSDMVMVVLCV